MYCRECGMQMPDDSKFCPACGERVTVRPKGTAAAAAQPAAEPAAQTAPADVEAAPASAPKKKKTWLLIAGIVLALAVVAGACVLIFGGGAPGGKTDLRGAESASAAIQEYAAALSEVDMNRVCALTGFNLERYAHAAMNELLADEGYDEQTFVMAYRTQLIASLVQISRYADQETLQQMQKEIQELETMDDLVSFTIELYPQVINTAFMSFYGEEYQIQAYEVAAQIPVMQYEWYDYFEYYNVYELINTGVLNFTTADIKSMVEVEFALVINGTLDSDDEEIAALAVETENGWYLIGDEVWEFIELY